MIPVFVSPRFRPARGVAPSTGDKPVLLQIGTKPNKNLERLIEAVAGLDCMLDIVGVLTGRQKELLARHKVDYRGASNLPADEIVERYQAGFSGGLQLLSRYRRCSPGT